MRRSRLRSPSPPSEAGGSPAYSGCGPCLEVQEREPGEGQDHHSFSPSLSTGKMVGWPLLTLLIGVATQVLGLSPGE